MVLAWPCLLKPVFIDCGNCVSAALADVPSESLRCLLCFELWGPWVEEEMCPRVSVWKKQLTAVLTKVDPLAGWLMAHRKLQGYRWGTGGSHPPASAAPAVGETCQAVLLLWAPLHRVDLRPPFPQPWVDLEGSRLSFDVVSLVFLLFQWNPSNEIHQWSPPTL